MRLRVENIMKKPTRTRSGARPLEAVFPLVRPGAFQGLGGSKHPWQITGTDWMDDAVVAIAFECLDCASPSAFARQLIPADEAGLSAFVHDGIAARGPASVGVWRVTAIGRDSGAAFEVLFRVVLAPTY